MKKVNSVSRLALLVCLVAAASLVRPVDARNGWQRFVDAIVPEQFREFFGGSPTEEAKRILSEAEILELEKPLDGTVEAGEVHPVRFSFPANGDEMPNILLSLSILNEDGDADLYCLPESLFEEGNAPPSSSFSVWKSEHSVGADHIFISRTHESYKDSRVQVTEYGNNGVAFVCSVYGYSPTGTDYVLEVDVDYTDRALEPSEKSAMQSLFDRCCLGSPSSCEPWKNTQDRDGAVSMEVCHLGGNICNEDGNLIRLDLSDLDMQCPFPMAAIAKLEKLQKLDLSSNLIRGEISEVLESLSLKKDLEYVNLNDNLLKGNLQDETLGHIPICMLTHEGGLTLLNLGDNNLETKLPQCMFDEKSTLRDLTLDGNIVEGGIPNVSENHALRILRLKDTGLQGTIPENMGLWKNLLVLNLANNTLEGSIPKNLGRSSPLLSVNLEANQLTGSIPNSLAVGAHLKYVRLSNNSLKSFGSMWYDTESMEESKLKILEVSQNSLEGPFPIATGSAPDLRVLVLADNNLDGRIVVQPGMFPMCVVFMIQNNNFSGRVPGNLKDMGFYSHKVRTDSPYFPEFDIANNEFSGDIPQHMWSSNIPEFLWKVIRVGGNNFNIPCPLPLNLIHLDDLKCENGESPVDEMPLELVPSQSLLEEEQGSVPNLWAVAPEVEDISGDDTDMTEPEEEPEEEPKEEPEAEIEFSEAELASVDPDVSGVSPEVNFLARSKLGGGISSDGEEDDSSEGSKSFVAQFGGYNILIVAGACLMLIMIISVVAVAAKKRRSAKSEILSDVLAMDLEMQSPVTEADEGDEQILLDRVKPSSVL